MRVGYVRVSTAEQNPARQVELMKSLDVEKVFLDKISVITLANLFFMNKSLL